MHQTIVATLRPKAKASLSVDTVVSFLLSKLVAKAAPHATSTRNRVPRNSARIPDYGKLKFVDQKRKAEARKKQKTIDIKEIKMRPGIDQHDYDVKMRAMRRFFEDGDKVKVTLRFRGREFAHQDLGMKVLYRVKDDLENEAKVESMPRMEGRQMVMLMSPK